MKTRPIRHRLAFVLSSLFYPLTYPDIVNSLESRGYKITLPEPRPPVPSGARMYIGGRLAMKEGCLVDIDPDKKIIACEGVEVSAVLRTTKELLDISTEDFSFDAKSDIDFAELNSEIIVESDSDPGKCLSASFEGLDLLDRFSGIIQTSVSVFRIGLTPKDSTPSMRDWFDLNIEPRLLAAKREYAVRVIYRKEKWEEIMQFTQQVEETVLKLIRELEGKSG